MFISVEICASPGFCRVCAAWICVLSCFCAFVRARCGSVRVFVWVCVCVWTEGGGGGAFVRFCCVYPIPVYLTRYLTSSFFLSWFHFLPALRGAEFIRTRFFLFLFTLLCTNCYSAISVRQETLLSEWLSFSFKLVWVDLPCNGISTCWTEWHAIQHDCSSLKLSGMCCHCLACFVQPIMCHQKSYGTLLWRLTALLFLQHDAFAYSQILLFHYYVTFTTNLDSLLLTFIHLPLCMYRACTVYARVYLYGSACATVCPSEWLTDKRPPEDGGMTIAHPSRVIQHSTGAINF